ncbi:hypothetical protein LJK88_49920 [Paenibacillus sp. P26]|nr:hypothetical protein LJK88_49920 [Paenibacillus sp. P26]
MNRALADDLAGGGFPVECMDSEAKQELYDAIGRLLARAQQAGAVRSDIGAADLVALISGILLAKNPRGKEGGSSERMLAVVFDGRAAAPAGAEGSEAGHETADRTGTSTTAGSASRPDGRRPGSAAGGGQDDARAACAPG